MIVFSGKLGIKIISASGREQAVMLNICYLVSSCSFSDSMHYRFGLAHACRAGAYKIVFYVFGYFLGSSEFSLVNSIISVVGVKIIYHIFSPFIGLYINNINTIFVIFNIVHILCHLYSIFL